MCSGLSLWMSEVLFAMKPKTSKPKKPHNPLSWDIKNIWANTIGFPIHTTNLILTPWSFEKSLWGLLAVISLLQLWHSAKNIKKTKHATEYQYWLVQDYMYKLYFGKTTEIEIPKDMYNKDFEFLRDMYHQELMTYQEHKKFNKKGYLFYQLNFQGD